MNMQRRSMMRRLNSDRYKGDSTMSISIDDIADLSCSGPGSDKSVGGNFSLACWDSAVVDNGGGFRNAAFSDMNSSDGFSLDEGLDDFDDCESGEEHEEDLRFGDSSAQIDDHGKKTSSQTATNSHADALRTRALQAHSLPWRKLCNERKRTVRFNTDTELISIERVDVEDYPLVYYGVRELQEMMDDFKLEERQAGRVVILPSTKSL
jgi:hypothetical protein